MFYPYLHNIPLKNKNNARGEEKSITQDTHENNITAKFRVLLRKRVNPRFSSVVRSMLYVL